eukprot:CAMPEP_0182938842 /NCGR_PEP_ID=MMETSP0105_2-20130417/44597_1 /TAXON_ID=81532 ORGANISM="Acanthoeca-like sp., Strain 10tr" /NCGR_SAMPLE_ID=MMETSP0105_2 /ASSEMBLY_ACC=CAM_ASM_000205 /LENGTH=67 /DNA_ID=CAMNT_0025078191 /DNA_START=204 /DNA_END=405 /DNA_ORIENTATION=+
MNSTDTRLTSAGLVENFKVESTTRALTNWTRLGGTAGATLKRSSAGDLRITWAGTMHAPALTAAHVV